MVAAAVPAQATTCHSSLSVSPAPGATPSANTEILLEGCGTAVLRLRGVAPDAFALTSGDRRIPVTILDRLPSADEVRQLVLRPAEAPAPDLPWTLELDGRPVDLLDHRPPGVPGFDDGPPRQPVTWRFEAQEASTDPPSWTSAPEVRSTTYVVDGGVPMAHASLTVPAQGATHVEATVWRVDGSLPPDRARIALHDGQIRLGNYMCSGTGNVELSPGVRYHASVVAVSATGARSPASGPPLTFRVPRKAQRW
jgi:hypothetical protein